MSWKTQHKHFLRTFAGEDKPQLAQPGPIQRVFIQGRKRWRCDNVSVVMDHLQALSLKRTGQRGQAEQQRNLEVVELIRINIYLITPEISCPITLLHQSVLIIANCLWAQCEGSHTRHQQSIEPKMISDVFSNQIWSVLIRSHLISIDPLTETRYDTDLSLWLIHLWNIGTQFY